MSLQRISERGGRWVERWVRSRADGWWEVVGGSERTGVGIRPDITSTITPLSSQDRGIIRNILFWLSSDQRPVQLLYEDNKSILWRAVGEYLCNNVISVNIY